MDAKEKRKRGGRYCVAGAPNNQSCKNTSYTEGITMHQFPTDPVVKNEWVKFVKKHRVDFGEPVNKYAALCSAHFEKSCYTRRFTFSEMKNTRMNRVLIKGSVPTRDAVLAACPEKLSKRAKRKLKRDAVSLQPESKKRKEDIKTMLGDASLSEEQESDRNNSSSFASARHQCHNKKKWSQALDKRSHHLHKIIMELKRRVQKHQDKVVVTETKEDKEELD